MGLKENNIINSIKIVEERERDPKTGLIDLLVYYEVPEGKREEVKHRFIIVF